MLSEGFEFTDVVWYFWHVPSTNSHQCVSFEKFLLQCRVKKLRRSNLTAVILTNQLQLFLEWLFKLINNKTCIKDCKNKNLSLLLQGLRQLAGCVANTAAVPLMRTLAWVWHSPSPMNQDTSKGFQSTFSLVQPCSTMKWKMYQNLF